MAEKLSDWLDSIAAALTEYGSARGLTIEAICRKAGDARALEAEVERAHREQEAIKDVLRASAPSLELLVTIERIVYRGLAAHPPADEPNADLALIERVKDDILRRLICQPRYRGTPECTHKAPPSCDDVLRLLALARKGAER